MTNNTLVAKSTKAFSLTPTNLEEAMRFAEVIAKSTMIPKSYQEKPGDVLIAILLGIELGLKPLQSLQNIATINGRPCMWGDAMLGLVLSTSLIEDIKEHYDEEKKAYVCTVKRKNQTEHTVTFSEEDAKKAALWGKSGPWSNYPKRMLQMRARGFALRDKFPDILGGLITREEAQDYPIDVTPQRDQGGEIIPFSKKSFTPEQNVKPEKTLAKEYMELCKELGVDPREFADKNKITSSDPESIMRGIELLTPKQTEEINLESVAN